ncbi:CP12 domain-containing protein [Gloeomargarita sp.]
MSQVFTTFEVNVDAQQEHSRRVNSLENRLRAAREHARRVTMMYAAGHVEIALAWEMVAELEKAQSQQQAPRLTNFQRYCLMYPEAPECRIYDL